MNSKKTPTKRGKEIATVYSEEDMYEYTPTPALNIPGLKEVRCLAPNDGKAYWLVDCEFEKRYKGGCPKCGSISYYGLGKEPKARLIHDINSGKTHIDIRINMPRYKCNEAECGKTFMYPTQIFAESHNITSRLLEVIQSESFVMEFKEIAKLHRISDSLVEKIFDEHCEDLELCRTLEGIPAPRVLGIDEKHIQHKMRGILVDIETGEPLEFLEDNSRKTIQQAIESLKGYEKIRVVTIDMANQYLGAIQECLPQAKIVIDHYHVIQNLITKVTTIKGRIHEYERLHLDPSNTHGADVLLQLSKNAYLFKFSKEKIKENKKRTQLLADVCHEFPNFNKLRALKETFEEIYDSTTRAEAEDKYKAWRERVKKCDKEMFAEMYSLMHSMDYWMPYVLNYFEPGCRFTNAASEGLNSLVQRMNLKGTGYSFKRLRAKLLLTPYSELAPEYVREKIKVVKKVTERTQGTGFHTGRPGNEYFFTTTREVTEYVDSVVKVPSTGNKIDYPCLFDLDSIPLYVELGEGLEPEDEDAFVE